MHRKLLVGVLTVLMGGVANAADVEKPGYQDNPEGDPQVLRQGPQSAPVHPQLEPSEDSAEIARQGRDGQPASAEPQFQLGPEHIDRAGAESPDGVAQNRFYRLDTDADGYLSRQEADQEIGSHWSRADQDADGKVDEAEFSAFETTRAEERSMEPATAPETRPETEFHMESR